MVFSFHFISFHFKLFIQGKNIHTVHTGKKLLYNVPCILFYFKFPGNDISRAFLHQAKGTLSQTKGHFLLQLQNLGACAPSAKSLGSPLF